MGQSRTTSSDSLQGLPYKVVSLRKRYEDGYVSTPHFHARHQVLHAVSGLVHVRAGDVSWVVPQGFGLLVPAGVEHGATMVGEVLIETVYIRAGPRTDRVFDSCRVVAISPLLTLLIGALCTEEAQALNSEKASHLRCLIQLELAEAPTSPFALRAPADPRLRRVCDALMAAPGSVKDIDHWASEAGKSRRSFTRAFQAETGLPFGQWRQRLRYHLALQRRAEGVAEAQIAAELGYASKYALAAMMQKLDHLGPDPG
ncbi:AraC family transcriptional regulator [Litoreibacter ponti]|uniref:AraC family transcriptional regulator n=1 Tax=Litoreibacter ponti TaxID=1510457 RepID=A0A2T6BER5_9RHOB|nr:helix-turn-helix transcriptional regulator [Litoreibacter ponti]PTX54553.1 AraC family transcriptional regulator [Litoreibacter ponti]